MFKKKQKPEITKPVAPVKQPKYVGAYEVNNGTVFVRVNPLGDAQSKFCGRTDSAAEFIECLRAELDKALRLEGAVASIYAAK